MSWKPEVKVSGKWEHNALVFATEQEASDNAYNLYCRWSLCENFRAVVSDDPVNYKWQDNRLEPVVKA